MIDMHYDLLSILYYCNLRKDFSYVEKISKYFNDNNVAGVIANLYFMSEDRMYNELGTKEINVVSMFKTSTELFKKYFPNTKVLFSIEGCDYIEDENQLEELYQLGLRNILLVWNNKNKYGSGNKSEQGLTKEGKSFLKKAISLGISIDLSHMNINTFWDTVNVLKEEKKNKPKVIISHSNNYEICKHPRNLTEDQIEALKEFDVVMGLIGYGPFTSLEENISDKDLKKKYLEHINKVVGILGTNHVGISTDDMKFATYLFNEEEGEQVLNYETAKSELIDLLKETYTQQEIWSILYKNINNKLFK